MTNVHDLLVRHDKRVILQFRTLMTSSVLDEVEAVLEAAHVVERERPGVYWLYKSDDSSLLQIWQTGPAQ